MKFPVFDLHCDTALAMVDEGQPLRKNQLHIDLERAAQLPGYCQCFACFTTPFMEEWGSGSPVTVFEKELDTLRRELAVNSDVIRQVYTAEEIEENRRAGLMSAVLTMEGPAGFGYDPELLEILHKAGFRMTTLGWNEKNPLCGSHKTGGGLTELGREYVRQAQRLGMLIDVSHLSDEGFWDIMDMTQAPVVATHSNSRAVWGESRNLTDDMFRAICATGGVAGLNLFSGFLGEKADLDTACDHVLHLMELDPEGRHIALGGDLDGCDALPEGFSGVQDYPKLASALLRRGLSQRNIENIYWNNPIEVMKQCCI